MNMQYSPKTNVSQMKDELVNLVFDGGYEEFHQDFSSILRHPIFQHRAGLSLTEAGKLAYARSKKVHGSIESPLNILGNPQRLFALAEWPSLMDVSMFSVLMVHYNLCLGTFYDHALDRGDLREIIDALDSMEAFGPYMATELGFGNNVAALQTEATYDHTEQCFYLNTPNAAAQKYMSYSGFSDLPKTAVVLARLNVGGKNCGVFPFAVKISDEQGLIEGVSAIPCPEKPVQGLDNGLTKFTNLKLQKSSLIHGEIARISDDGEFVAITKNPRKRFLRSMSRIVPGRLCVSSSAVGAGKASIYLAIKYSEQRLTNAPGNNNTPIIEYRSHQLALFTCLAKVYAMVNLLNRSKRAFLNSTNNISHDLNNLISVTKALSTWEMTEVVAMCRERCGAQGIFSSNRIADYGSLLQGLVTAEGDNIVLMSATASQYLAQLGDIGQPIPPGIAGKNLQDIRWLTELLNFREVMLCHSIKEAKAENLDGDFFSVQNKIANKSLEMISTRGVRLALEAMSSAADEAVSKKLKFALNLLARMYALHQIGKHAGWYLSEDSMSPEHVREMADEIDNICEQLRPVASLLIDGFALSPELLQAPICQNDYIDAFVAQSESERSSTPDPRNYLLGGPRQGKHIYKCPLRWADMDIYGVVNNVVYFRLFEQARVDFIWGLGPAGDDAFFGDGSVVVEQDITYKQPLVYRHEPVIVETTVCDLKASTVTMRTRVIDGGNVCAEGTTTMAPFNYEKKRPRRLTDAETEFFSHYVECEAA